MTRAEWSGWVQAIGSIVAIAGAVWLTQRQLDAAARTERSRRQEARTSFYVACEGLLKLAANVRRHSINDPLQRRYVDTYYRLDNFKGVLDRLDHMLGQMAAADPLVLLVGEQLKQLGEMLAAQVREMVDIGAHDPELGERFAAVMSTVHAIEERRPMVNSLVVEPSR